MICDIVPGRTRVGWIGTGVMGFAMCSHLLKAGYSVTVYSRTRERAEGLVEKGAAWAESPDAVGRCSDVVISMVGFPADVRAVFLGSHGVISHLKPGSIVIDMTTSEPSLAVEIYTQAHAKTVASLDAPVSGGDIGAKNATLSIMVGGDADIFECVRPFFSLMGSTIVHQGGPGAGQHTKLVNQTLIAGGMIGLCEALLYAYKAGLDLESVIASVSQGAAGSWALTNYSRRMCEGNFDPGFFVEHFSKDMAIALAEARRMKLSMPGLALAHQLYVALEAQGGGRQGIHALVRALADISRIEWPPPR
ncbi:MAG TPA: NAD(P)-dependent oxidoreductase [Nitrospirales bacterium]|nr:NAD(P)-dependent oxidoreductase [Nitrospirales bacterium]HIB54179.1 NAD(P)-dependent oxidoreductase [Nitrospirales bacterium]HIN34084.1 NAD(P)-dependent oxidoreductase [Nitrospirales bacterium]